MRLQIGAMSISAAANACLIEAHSLAYWSIKHLIVLVAERAGKCPCLFLLCSSLCSSWHKFHTQLEWGLAFLSDSKDCESGLMDLAFFFFYFLGGGCLQNEKTVCTWFVGFLLSWKTWNFKNAIPKPGKVKVMDEQLKKSAVNRLLFWLYLVINLSLL